MADTHATHHSETVVEAMDYGEHNRTWGLVTSLVKWGIFTCAMLVLALYFFIIAGNAWMGLVLLLLVPVVIIGTAVMGGPRR
jgi:ABC-type nickel/cobalt efflux system permease component RcnA